MHLAWGPEEEAFRAELGAFLDAHAPPEARGRGMEPEWGEGGIPEWARQWQALLFDHGWLIPGYPPELGGRNANDVQTLVFFEELATRGIPRALHFPGHAIVAPSLLEFGTEKQKELVPAAIRGDTVWCIGMSEPGAGSDLASMRTRAELDGDHFVVNGQKVWTSYAMWSQMCFLYVRTGARDSKQRGISVLILDMATPGIDVRPLRQATGGVDFAEVFFTDVVVPVENLIGEMNDGWRVTMGSLAHERAGLWLEWIGALDHLFRRIVDQAKAKGVLGDENMRGSLAAAYEEVAGLRALGYKGFATYEKAGAAPEHALLKLATSELRKRLAQIAVEIDPTPENRRELLGSFSGTIGGGTSEIQRNAIARHVLGLPRSY
ncbi:MAG: acyl-CoA dehydrogenase family protein [Acidimicrobiia bacterium]